MSEVISLTPPLSDQDTENLKIGDQVIFNGVIYTARDAAHKRLVELIDKGELLPYDVKGAVIYYVGPTPARPGEAIGSAGPTTSYRMDPYAPRLIELGLKGMIGKGNRGQNVLDAMQQHKAVYFTATGGAAALIARWITKCEVIAYPDLGAEAIHRLEVKDFQAVVANDCHGGDLFREGIKKYRKD